MRNLFYESLQEQCERFGPYERKTRNETIDEFVAIMEEWNDNIKSIRNEEAFFTIEDIRKVAEQMKGK